jgi:hypothetical protein
VTGREQLRALARPFTRSQVKRKPGKGGGDYVEHNTVTERLLWIVGPFSTRIVEVIRGDVPEWVDSKGKAHPPIPNAVVGVILRLTVTIDGREVSVEGAGDVGSPHNWEHDGQRLKDAESDGIKRAAMRIGCGLHLWSQESYFLPQALDHETDTRQKGAGDGE